MPKYTVSTNRIGVNVTAKNEDEAIEKGYAQIKKFINLGVMTLTAEKQDSALKEIRKGE
jgi:hypothetical protein